MNNVESISSEDSEFVDATQLIVIEDTIKDVQDKNFAFLKASWVNMTDHIEKEGTSEDGFSKNDIANFQLVVSKF